MWPDWNVTVSTNNIQTNASSIKVRLDYSKKFIEFSYINSNIRFLFHFNI